MNATTIETTTIRSTPGGEVVRTVKANTKLDITLDIGNWYKVNSVEGVAQAGYINGRSVKITITTPPPPPPPVGDVVPFTLAVDGYKPVSGNLEPV